jgi:hypothetical protein
MLGRLRNSRQARSEWRDASQRAPDRTAEDDGVLERICLVVVSILFIVVSELLLAMFVDLTDRIDYVRVIAWYLSLDTDVLHSEAHGTRSPVALRMSAGGVVSQVRDDAVHNRFEPACCRSCKSVFFLDLCRRRSE